MRRERALDDPRIRRKLADLRGRRYNFDPSRRAEYTTADGWHDDDLRRALPAEAPGPPEPGGSWEIARRLMAGYEFADPSMVRAYYDPAEPLEGRTMLLEIRFAGLLRFDVGTRVSAVYDEERTVGDRRARVWGWAYRTLEGHFEKGQMDWQVWKSLDTGAVEFRIHAYSRRSADPNPVIRLGFRIFGRREQLAFLHSTTERIARLTETALRDPRAGAVWAQAESLTARGGFSTAPAHTELADRVGGTR
jgi:uncharacterized protein (UPF0548 family)